MHYRIFYALALVIFVTACSTTGKTNTSAPTQYGLATRMDQHSAGVVSKSGSNLVTGSDTFEGWTFDGGFARAATARGGAVVAELAGTGAVSGDDIYSGIISVRPGGTYTFSVWADASHFSKNSPSLFVMKISRDVVYGPEFHFSGPAGRFSGTVTIPKDVTQVRLDVSCSGGTIARNQKFRVSAPVLMAAR